MAGHPFRSRRPRPTRSASFEPGTPCEPGPAGPAPDTTWRPARRAAAGRVIRITGRESPGHRRWRGLHCRVMAGSTASARGALPLSPDEMWAAFIQRDRRYDGRFIVGVRSTGIYCPPVCTCRKPRRERVESFASPGAAQEAGYRPCKRCRPELPGGPAEAARRLAQQALAVMRARLDEPLTLAVVAGAVASSPPGLPRRPPAAPGRPPRPGPAAPRPGPAAA